MKKTKNLFFFRTEAEAICSCLIAKSLGENEDCIFFAFKQKSLNVAKKFGATNTQLLTNKAKGFYDRTKEIQEQTKSILAAVERPNKIVIYLGRLNNSTINYYIYALLKEFPRADIAVHIIPHGLKAQKLRKISALDKIKIQVKNWARRPFGIGFYSRIYDEYGFLSPITKKIYVFPGFEQDVRSFHSQVEAIPVGVARSNKTESIKNRMLVIGQKNIANKHMPENDANKITEKIKSIAAENNIAQVDYLSHPRRKEAMELYSETFSIIETEYSAEVVALEGPYKIIASFSSTGLIFAKLLLGASSTRVISVGANSSQLLSGEQGSIMRVMRNVGVEVIDI